MRKTRGGSPPPRFLCWGDEEGWRRWWMPRDLTGEGDAGMVPFYYWFVSWVWASSRYRGEEVEEERMSEPGVEDFVPGVCWVWQKSNSHKGELVLYAARGCKEITHIFLQKLWKNALHTPPMTTGDLGTIRNICRSHLLNPRRGTTSERHKQIYAPCNNQRISIYNTPISNLFIHANIMLIANIPSTNHTKTNDSARARAMSIAICAIHPYILYQCVHPCIYPYIHASPPPPTNNIANKTLPFKCNNLISFPSMSPHISAHPYNYIIHQPLQEYWIKSDNSKYNSAIYAIWQLWLLLSAIRRRYLSFILYCLVSFFHRRARGVWTIK